MATLHERARLWRRLVRKGANKERIARDVLKNPELLSDVLDGLNAEEAAIRYGCAKVIRNISEREPSVLYPRIGFFIELLGSENTIFQWEAIMVLGNLASVDSQRKIDRILDRYLASIKGPVMITAGNTIKGATKIAVAKPKLTDRIVEAILGVEKARYKTPECRNIAIGHALEALDELFDRVHDAKPVLSFARRQLKNARSATKRKAERFLKRRE